MGINIAIDGPAGAGKSTIAKLLAKELSFIYVDTGAMYRAIAYALMKNTVPVEDSLQVAAKLQDIHVRVRYDEKGEQRVFLGEEDVTPFLRTEEVSNMASRCAAIPAVRERLLQLQRQLAEENNVIMDGRDIGTTILPDAQVKIYLTASAQARAERRYQEMIQKGEECSFEEILEDIRERDTRDMNRDVSPLCQAADAVLVDSSALSVEEVVGRILEIVREKIPNV